MDRPKKYHSDQQRKAAKKASIAPQIKGKYFRLVIPNLLQFKDKPDELLKLKGDTLNLLLSKQKEKGLQYYKIAVQTHPTSQVPHLDVLLLYSKSVAKSLNRFDYLVKHGSLSSYKKLNQAILAYGDKQDPCPLTNMPSAHSSILKAKQLQSDPYFVLEQQMLKDPFHFDPYVWMNQNRLAHSISKTNWSKAISLLKHQQQAQCNRRLYDKPGFRFISKDLIKQCLTAREYTFYNKNRHFYDKITQKINEIVTYGCDRPFKSKQLFLVSPPDCGKTSLALRIKQCVATYHMGVNNWWPRYRSGVYKMILWDQFNLRSMPYPDLLKFLQGLSMDLQYKGGSTLRTDNQLVIMTSNMTLQQHICSRFQDQNARQKSRANLRARVQQVILPPGVHLFILQKLIKSL